MPKVKVIDHAVITSFQGHPGDFMAILRTPSGLLEVRCGAAILAMDAVRVEEKNGDKGIIALHELSPQSLRINAPGPVVIMLSREDGERGSHIDAVRKAIAIKEQSPDTEVILIVRELRTFGLGELEYREAQTLGVLFVRVERAPVIRTDGELAVSAVDLTSGRELTFRPQLLAMEATLSYPDTKEMGGVFKVPVSKEGPFIRPNIVMGPAASMRMGVYLCGSAVTSQLEEEAATEVIAAASGAVSLISSGYVEYFGDVAEVDREKCSACLTCLRTCPFNAPLTGTEGKAEVDEERCRGCGVCAGICPSKAITMRSYSDQVIEAESGELLGGRR
jgi:heterodisulfide reductase subunit A-like polyferredoxin